MTGQQGGDLPRKEVNPQALNPGGHHASVNLPAHFRAHTPRIRQNPVAVKDSTGSDRHGAQRSAAGLDPAQQLRRRHAACRRLPALSCGCVDPLVHRCRPQPQLTEHQLDAWRDTTWHVLATGLVPLLPIEVRRALYRRGGTDRALAELLHDSCGGEAA